MTKKRRNDRSRQLTYHPTHRVTSGHWLKKYIKKSWKERKTLEVKRALQSTKENRTPKVEKLSGTQSKERKKRKTRREKRRTPPPPLLKRSYTKCHQEQNHFNLRRQGWKKTWSKIPRKNWKETNHTKCLKEQYSAKSLERTEKKRTTLSA